MAHSFTAGAYHSSILQAVHLQGLTLTWLCRSRRLSSPPLLSNPHVSACCVPCVVRSLFTLGARLYGVSVESNRHFRLVSSNYYYCTLWQKGKYQSPVQKHFSIFASWICPLAVPVDPTCATALVIEGTHPTCLYCVGRKERLQQALTERHEQ